MLEKYNGANNCRGQKYGKNAWVQIKKGGAIYAPPRQPLLALTSNGIKQGSS
jgi:hypothetical protein